ncbi:tetratricopeptide repeat protein [Actinophytocola sp.]|uniref:tetratricopeptide repeat protein n=1 Tax=Actinophytocola sp. TaxID=1872138 RepID=UPI002D30FE07|nr:tetratricopeptide repeat protein [Actinophytocola sp.]HYQ69992.1 tetratricopeptide repeat protein [Actinophytocola sp.]
MNAPLQPTDEQIAAAQLRIELDKKLDRGTPEIVRQIATYRPTTRPTQDLRPPTTTDQYHPAQAPPHTWRTWEAETPADRLAAIRRQADFARNAIERARAAQPPQEPELLNNLALALRDAGDPDQAIDLLRQALTIHRQQRAETIHRQQRAEADDPSTTE